MIEQDVWDMADKVFDSRRISEEWMNTVVPALGDRKPIELMNSVEGREMISDALARITTGDYS